MHFMKKRPWKMLEIEIENIREHDIERINKKIQKCPSLEFINLVQLMIVKHLAKMKFLWTNQLV